MWFEKIQNTFALSNSFPKPREPKLSGLGLGIFDGDAQCYARCLKTRAGREKASKRMQLAKKGKFITDSSQGFCHIQRSGAGSEKAPSPGCYPNL